MTPGEKFLQVTLGHPPVPLPEKCLVISDVHASNGVGDPLVGCAMETTLLECLREHFDKGFTLVTLGDWWDVWRGESLVDILHAHSQLMNMVVLKYRDSGRLYEILGNHERPMCSFNDAMAFEGYGKKVFMDHGWIGDVMNDEFWQIARQLVHLAKESGVDPHSSPHPENIDRHMAIQQLRHDLARQHEDWEFIFGHTHFWEDSGNLHNTGSPLNGKIEGFKIVEGNIIPL